MMQDDTHETAPHVFVKAVHGVRYQVKDVARSAMFYTQYLGFTLKHQQLPAFAGGVVGPVGFEPTTKGFTLPRCFHRAWTISSPPARRPVGCGTLDACHQGHCSPQVVSAPSGGVPPAWLRVAISRAGRIP